MNNINIEEFQKVEIRVGTVLSVEKAEGADKLLKLIFDFGPLAKVEPSNENSQDETGKGSTLQSDKREIAADSSSPRNDEEKRDIRQVMSAIAGFYPDPSVLVGKQIAVCVNLEPRKFRGYESQGMIMATDTEDGQISLLIPEKQVKPGAKVH